MDWQPQAPITVRTTRGMDGYDYEIVNTQDDEGAMAKFVSSAKRDRLDERAVSR
jgi:hypothetical protein